MRAQQRIAPDIHIRNVPHAYHHAVSRISSQLIEQRLGGVATIQRVRGEKVLGTVYEISEQCLRQLDRYEGYPDAYDRLKVTVFDQDGNPIEAITYIKSGQLKETPPSKEYLAIIQQGYKDWRII